MPKPADLFAHRATTAIRSHRTPAPVKHDVRSALGRGPLGARLRSLGTACAVGCGDAQSSPGLRVRQGWSSGAAELVRARVYKERAHASRAFAGRLDTERAALVWLWKVGQPEPHGFCPSLLIDHARGLKIHSALEGSRRSDSLQSEGAINDDLGMMMPLKPAVQAHLPPTREAAEVAAADADCPTGRRDLCADPRKPVGEPNRSGRALVAFLLEPFRSSKRVRSKHAIDCQTAAKPGTQPLVGWVSGRGQPKVHRPLPRRDQSASTPKTKKWLRCLRLSRASDKSRDDDTGDHSPHWMHES